MSKRVLRRYLQKQNGISRNRILGPLKAYLLEPGLWHIGRRSVSRAIGIGLFVAFLPVPQTLLVSFLVILARANLPLAITMIMVTNPLTLPLAFYMNYQVGSWLLRTPSISSPESFSISWLMEQISSMWVPLWLGSIFVGAVFGLTGLLVSDYGWQLYVRYKQKNKPHLKKTRKS